MNGTDRSRLRTGKVRPGEAETACACGKPKDETELETDDFQAEESHPADLPHHYETRFIMED